MSRNVTYRSWKDRLYAEIWPFGPPENAIASLDAWVTNACMECQRYIPCVRNNNVALFPFCSTFFNAWLTWVKVPLPSSFIRAVYTVANDDYTNKVWYHQRDYGVLRERSQNQLSRLYGRGPAVRFPQLTLGDRYSDPLTDKYASWIFPVGSNSGRSHRGVWARHQARLWLSPWIQSNETIVVEWDGIKVEWLDTDLIDLDTWNPLYEDAIKWYVKHQYQAHFEADRAAEQAAAQYHAVKLASLIIDCRNQTENDTEECNPESYSPTPDQLQSEQVSIAPVVTTIAAIANYGFKATDAENPAAAAVAALVNAWKPNGVLTAGGNNLDDPTSLDVWDLTVGRFYSAFLFPYFGQYLPGGRQNSFWPALGDAEIGSAEIFSEYFSATERRRYYTTEIGDVQIFVLDGSAFEIDGNTVGSIQAIWLQTALALSVARWKVVVVADAPFSSGTIGSTPALQWPFKSWGADLVISGNEAHYERLLVDGLTYVICGSGGKALNVPGVTVTNCGNPAINGNYAAIASTVFATPGYVYGQYQIAYDAEGATWYVYDTDPPEGFPNALYEKTDSSTVVGSDWVSLLFDPVNPPPTVAISEFSGRQALDATHYGAFQLKSTQPAPVPGVLGPNVFGGSPPSLTPATLQGSFIDTDGVTRDSFTLTK